MKPLLEKALLKEASINKIQFDKEWFYKLDDISFYLKEDLSNVDSIYLPMLVSIRLLTTGPTKISEPVLASALPYLFMMANKKRYNTRSLILPKEPVNIINLFSPASIINR